MTNRLEFVYTWLYLIFFNWIIFDNSVIKLKLITLRFGVDCEKYNFNAFAQWWKDTMPTVSCKVKTKRRTVPSASFKTQSRL